MAEYASVKQMKFINSLLEQKELVDLPPLMVDHISAIQMGYPESIGKLTGSRMIEILLSRPKKKSALPSNPPAKAGRYAVKIDDKMRFFDVSTPNEGRWAGYVFLNEQAGGEFYPIRDNRRRAMILNAINDDPDSLARYGQELGVCGLCNRPLTDEVSRSIGIGPICRKK